MLQKLGQLLAKHEQQEHILYQEHRFELIEMLAHILLQVQVAEQIVLLDNIRSLNHQFAQIELQVHTLIPKDLQAALVVQ